MHPSQHLAALAPLRAGPGARAAVLRAAECGSDADPAELPEAGREVCGEHEALLVLLSGQWGEPRWFGSEPHLPAAADGAVLSEPEATLCGHLARVAVWTVEGRCAGLGPARRSEAVPLRLLAAVGEQGTPVLPPAPSVLG